MGYSLYAGFIPHFLLWFYTMALFLASYCGLYHGFILAFMLGFMSLMLQGAPCEPASASVVESREPAAAIRLIGTILGHLAGGAAAQGGRSPPGYYSALFYAL